MMSWTPIAGFYHLNTSVDIDMESTFLKYFQVISAIPSAKERAKPNVNFYPAVPYFILLALNHRPIET
jgi:hypothetical protein